MKQNYSEQQTQELQKVFRQRRFRQVTVSPIVILFLVPLFISENLEKSDTLWGLPTQWWLFISGGMLISAIVFSFWNWRCPGCNRYLGRNIWARFCHSCGLQLKT